MKPVIIIAIAFVLLLPLFTIPTYAQNNEIEENAELDSIEDDIIIYNAG